MLVCLDEPHSWTTSGGALSGPVCAEVLGKVLPYLGWRGKAANKDSRARVDMESAPYVESGKRRVTGLCPFAVALYKNSAPSLLTFPDPVLY